MGDLEENTENLNNFQECPVCMEEIKTLPVYQCTNGHVICLNCIPKLEKCPICRDESLPVRSSKSEKIVIEIMGLQQEYEVLLNEVFSKKPENLKWGVVSSPKIRENQEQNNGSNFGTIQEMENRNNSQSNSIIYVLLFVSLIFLLVFIIIVIVLWYPFFASMLA